MFSLPNREEIDRNNAEQKAITEKHHQLIHQVFEQSSAGKELLTYWKETLMLTPTVTGNATQFQAGIEEGHKEFIRNIILTIKSVEGK